MMFLSDQPSRNSPYHGQNARMGMERTAVREEEQQGLALMQKGRNVQSPPFFDASRQPSRTDIKQETCNT